MKSKRLKYSGYYFIHNNNSNKMYLCVGDYIIQAAKQISLAQQCEANGNYHMAFTYYKSGIGTLITGVQGNLGFLSRDF